ncbi:DUF6497 family protein [Ruegeria arenilitoris]|uniref:DUF6497 family protein n=1 Tax=Ruegeria arenilitoris TaxID=1173585 RepID=UPI00147F2064|nr:DUF6497 family protein [Ruegeria arenilitoris]
MIPATRYGTAQEMILAPATPEGGACLWRVRGRALVLAFMCFGSPGFAQDGNLLPVPSGQPVTLEDVLVDTNPGELWLRFRFVAPKIGDEVGSIGYDVAATDMEHLCQTLAIPYVAHHQLSPARVVISLSDRPVEFGNSSPDATQYFEAYRLEQSACIWEGL